MAPFPEGKPSRPRPHSRQAHAGPFTLFRCLNRRGNRCLSASSTCFTARPSARHGLNFTGRAPPHEPAASSSALCPPSGHGVQCISVLPSCYDGIYRLATSRYRVIATPEECAFCYALGGGEQDEVRMVPDRTVPLRQADAFHDHKLLVKHQ